jgi:hypothetical protein
VQDVPPEPPPLQRAGAEVLDEHVGVGEELAGHLRPGGVGQLERHRALVAADERPPERDAVLRPAQRTQVVAGGLLDLDHVGAVVAEHRADDGTGEERRGVDHAQAVERERAHDATPLRARQAS